MKPVRAYTFQGKAIVFVLHSLLALVSLITGRRWKRPVKGFSENSLRFSLTDVLYLSYKYYYAAITEWDTPESSSKINRTFSPPHVPDGAPEITLTAGGDLMPYNWIQKPFSRHLWDDIGTDLFASDLVFANLETPVDPEQDKGFVPEVMLNHMEFNGTEEMLDIFNGNGHYKGFDVFSTANNHSYDKGEQGIINTIRLLERNGIKYCGTAVSADEVMNFPIIEKNGIRVAFIGASYSLNHLTLPKGKEYLCNHIEVHWPDCDLSLLKQQTEHAYAQDADVVVASLHYGNAYQLFPSDHVIDVTHRIFNECGVDVIIGNHAHNLQPHEFYEFTCPIKKTRKTGYAAYALGDFVAYDIFTWGHLPIYVKLTLAKTGDGVVIKNVTVNPVYTYGHYIDENNRDLRFLDARKLWSDAEQGKYPTFFTNEHKKELGHLKEIFRKVYPE